MLVVHGTYRHLSINHDAMQSHPRDYIDHHTRKPCGGHRNRYEVKSKWYFLYSPTPLLFLALVFTRSCLCVFVIFFFPFLPCCFRFSQTCIRPREILIRRHSLLLRRRKADRRPNIRARPLHSNVGFSCCCCSLHVDVIASDTQLRLDFYM
jgi:hypothetical protein